MLFSKIKFNKIKIKNNQGLTLMETTIALGILMIGILASLTLMLASFNYVQEGEHEIVVVNLAREGIELMRAIRNNNDINLFDGSYDNTNYIIDNTTSNLSSNSVSATNINQCTQCNLYLKDGQYLHDASGSKTIFKRMIGILPGTTDDEKIIISEVSWTVKNKTHHYLLESHLTNWQ